MNSQIYAVRKGRQTGLFPSWEAILPLVNGYAGASYKKFKTVKEAEIYLRGDETSQLVSVTDLLKSNRGDPLPSGPKCSPQPFKPTDIRCFLKKPVPATSSSQSHEIISDQPSQPVKLENSVDQELKMFEKTMLHRMPVAKPKYHMEVRRQSPEQGQKSSDDSNGRDAPTVAKEIKPTRGLVVISSSETQIPSKPQIKVKIYCDGSCIGNGKKNAIGGIGIYFPDENYSKYNVSEPFTKEHPASNNKTEIYALTRTLDIVHHIITSNPQADYQFEILTDSEYTINCLTQWLPNWMRRQWVKADGKPVKNVELLKDLSASYNRHRRQVQIRYTKGHTGLKDGNFYADAFAVEGSRKHPKYKPHK